MATTIDRGRRDLSQERGVTESSRASRSARRNPERMVWGKCFAEPAPWALVLNVYDALLILRDDPVVRINRAVALAEVAGAATALDEIDALDGFVLETFPPYHAVRADLLRRTGRCDEAREAYNRVLELCPPPAERLWLERRLRDVDQS